jgi:hypothetical protein
VKIVAISPQPSDDEAAAIAAALAQLNARRIGPDLRLGRYSRASLGTLHLDAERRRTWRESARLDALDAGV